MAEESIFIKGARVHNLKDVSVRLPRNKIIVITGVSGSGKSSLAFDTLYAEGQRRYVESLSAYARQFIGLMQKPDVDLIEGLSPAIAIDQKSASKNPRSTVGTLTEIYDYLRLLFARAGVPYCPNHNIPITKQSPQEIVEHVLAEYKGRTVALLAPAVEGRKGEYRKLIEDVQRKGFENYRVDGTEYSVDDPIPSIDKKRKHTIELIVDKLLVTADERTRLFDSVELALKEGNSVLKVLDLATGKLDFFSSTFACPICGYSIQEIEPRLFSFNSPYGACPTCTGLGFQLEPDIDMIVDRDKSLAEGAIQIPGFLAASTFSKDFVVQALRFRGYDPDQKVRDLPPGAMEIVLHGDKERIPVHWEDGAGLDHVYKFHWEGLINLLARRYEETTSDAMKEEYERFMLQKDCPTCHGRRLKPEALAVKLAGLNISEVTDMSVDQASQYVAQLPGTMTETQRTIAKQVLREINERLKFILDVGLGYLTLSRASATLAGGEAQRLRLATQVGSKLVGVLYVLDEPSIGLHPRDNERLLSTLRELRDLGNTLVIVEHDEETIRTADYLVDVGPGAGEHGGRIVAAGSLADIIAEPTSLTGQYLTGKLSVPLPKTRRKPNGEHLLITGATEHNLKNIDADIPLHMFTCITGVSGSGKSTLINDCLYKGLARELYHAKDQPGHYEKLTGVGYIDRVIVVDQGAIGRTPRSNPATYTGLFTPIREVFARMPEAKVRGYQPGRFSFNVKGGRCEACEGNGFTKVEMQFLPDVYVPCEVCHGARFNSETLEVRYKGKSIADVLEMSVEEALQFFDAHARLKHMLKLLDAVGLGYIRLGQSAVTLSGGEAQRIKLASELGKRTAGKTLYILDEPTTGLHFADVEKLVGVLQELTNKGNTVIVIEHNLEVIKNADWVIDLGPEGGDKGGRIIATGTPEEIARNPDSLTGQFLAPKVLRAQR
ncbi:excinuclease ABC subunit UvrA [Candidatus Cryosericum hinesii]|jgi:excinuclease ABC subunit A|uniref:UvrABC system protein A n=3 Tax=Candidatus Cryosericum hinesii TaxID=2290915 RepID=A0A398DF14_9BACT|nr:excinuclease ABC subunit UvrA [Candidatus Cryosericum hinesii]RIE14102.1 excinuclease ABC subunit UvrA [Candidatus Cryosericum hinesii]